MNENRSVGNVYKVTAGKEFVLLFSPTARDIRSAEEFEFKRTELKNRFLKNYSPEMGFSIYYDGSIGQEGRYVIFTEADRFMTNVSNTGASLCMYVKDAVQITQSDTLNKNVQSVRIIGLPTECLCLGGNKQRFGVAGERQPQGASDGTGLREMLSYVRGNSIVLPDQGSERDQEIVQQLSMLEEQRQIIRAKKEFVELPENLMTLSYSRFDPVRQDISDGILYKFRLSNPDSVDEQKMKEGTGVNIPVSDDGKPIKGTVSSYKEPWLVIKFNTHDDFFSRIAKSGEIKESPNPEYQYKLNAIKSLQNGTSPSIHLMDIIFSHNLLTMPAKIPYRCPAGGTIRMNPMQEEAVRKALNTEDFLLVQGPPGTGKTTIITEMIRNFVKEGKRVLICSKNNLAVDNVIEGCMDLYYDDRKTKKMQCVRFGNQEKVLKSIYPVLPMQLTMTLQNDIKRESALQRSRFQNESSDRRQLLTAARHDIGDLCTIMQKVYQEYSLLLNLEHKSRSEIGYVFLGIRYGRKFRTVLSDMSLEADQILKAVFALLQVGNILAEGRISSTQVAEWKQELGSKKECFTQQYDLFLTNGKILLQMFDQCNRRTKLVFGEGKLKTQEALSADYEAEDQVRKTVSKYQGNAASAILPRLQKPYDPSEDEGSKLKEEIANELDELKEKLESISNILREWDKELDDPKLSLQEDLLHSLKIVGATCIGINTSDTFRQSVFDVAIVDEAGQITLHDLLVPLEKAKKIILIGDHMQLPPMGEDDFCTYAEEHRLLGFRQSDGEEGIDEYRKKLRRLFEKSLFEELYRSDEINSSNKVMLDTQFRMHPVIAEFISQQFYGGSYKSADGMADNRTLKFSRFTKPMYFIDTSEAPDHEETPIKDANGNSGGYYNTCEANIIGLITVELILEITKNSYTMHRKRPEDNPLIKSEDKSFDIGIITAYKGQKKKIRDAIRQALREKSHMEEAEVNDLVEKISVDTLDSFQGRDNQIILYSFVRSNKKRRIGFLNEVRRLNVMMTRAKSLLIMVGDSATLAESKANTVHEPEKRASDYYKALLEYCRTSRYAVLSHYKPQS